MSAGMGREQAGLCASLGVGGVVLRIASAVIDWDLGYTGAHG